MARHGSREPQTDPNVTQTLPDIPLLDMREGGTVRHAGERRDNARALRDTCVAWFPAAARPLVPVLDAVARWWLQRSASPYVAEIRAIAGALGFPGIWFLNGSYQWSCTACCRDENGAPWLVRTLDWPFPGLGRHLAVAHQQGPAGDFFNLTWPGYVGVLTAMAPGRFAASINQAPLRRRTLHPLLRVYDLLANALGTLFRVREIPPDQLLRQAFEQARDFGEARAMLERTPVARPVIYTLAGARAGERCVIERTESDFLTRTDVVVAANDWISPRPYWEGRIGADQVLRSSFEDAAINSRERRTALGGWPGTFSAGGFAWVEAPVLNRFTRLAAEMCPARGELRVVGYELHDGDELPRPVTAVRAIGAGRAAA